MGEPSPATQSEIMTDTVLVVDDDPMVHRVLGHYLERAGYQLSTAHTGRQAIELATRDMPRLIIMDVMLPEMSGLEALRELKDGDLTKEIPVIVLTSSAVRATELESTASGAAVFLTKPFTELELMTAVRRLVSERAKG